MASRGFLRDIARFALPAGTVMAASVIFAYLAVAHVKDHTEADGRTAATTVFVAFGVYLLLVLDADRMQASRRHAVVVVAMAAALLAGYLWGAGVGDRPRVLRADAAGLVGADRGHRLRHPGHQGPGLARPLALPAPGRGGWGSRPAGAQPVRRPPRAWRMRMKAIAPISDAKNPADWLSE